MQPFFLLLCALSTASAAVTPYSEQDVGFAADPSINAKAIFEAAKQSTRDVMASFRASQEDKKPNVNIFGDWRHLHGVSAIHFIADMDVDCDGVDFRCPHNPDGQPQTSFGHLDASKVPFYVIPLSFHQEHTSDIKPNALGAVICNGKMFYGIFGDEDGDTPEVIGEASILMAQTCFPHEHLDGGNGHTPLDVLYVIFGREVPSGVGDVTIDITALKKLGDQEARKLASALGV